MARPYIRVTSKNFKHVCERLAEGESLTRICLDADLPTWKTILRYVQKDEKNYQAYRNARALQAEVMRDEIIDLVGKALPADPKLAMAEVGRRRLEADYKDKMIRQLAPLGVRNKQEDKADEVGEIVIKWGAS